MSYKFRHFVMDLRIGMDYILTDGHNSLWLLVREGIGSFLGE